MKTRLAIWLGVELLVAAAIGSAACIHRRDEVIAFRAWYDNPTLETRKELDRQRRITIWNVGFAGILFAGMAILTVPMVFVVSHCKGSGFESPQQHAA